MDSRYYGAMAAALRETGQFAGSLSAFESSLELHPGDPIIATAAAEAALLAGNRAKSNRYAKIARHLGASEQLTRRLELMETMRTEMTWGPQHDREVSASRASIHSGVNIVNMYLHRARDCFVEGQDVEAIAALDSVLRLEADNVPAYLLRGITYGYMKRYDEAISDMTQVIRLEPDSAMAHYHRGMAYGDQDDLDSAIADLDEAIRLGLNDAGVYRARGDCHCYRGEIRHRDCRLRPSPAGRPRERPIPSWPWGGLSDEEGPCPMLAGVASLAALACVQTTMRSRQWSLAPHSSTPFMARTRPCRS